MQTQTHNQILTLQHSYITITAPVHLNTVTLLNQVHTGLWPAPGFLKLLLSGKSVCVCVCVCVCPLPSP